MGHHYCDQGNRLCAPGNPCTPCSGTKHPLRDREQVRVKVGMMFMDSAQRAIAAATTNSEMQDARAQALADHEAWLLAGGDTPDHRSPEERSIHDQALASNRVSNAYALASAARRQALVNHHHGASNAAYAEMCAQLQKGADWSEK